jgi:hypothetical protein
MTGRLGGPAAGVQMLSVRQSSLPAGAEPVPWAQIGGGTVAFSVTGAHGARGRGSPPIADRRRRVRKAKVSADPTTWHAAHLSHGRSDLTGTGLREDTLARCGRKYNRAEREDGQGPSSKRAVCFSVRHMVCPLLSVSRLTGLDTGPAIPTRREWISERSERPPASIR